MYEYQYTYLGFRVNPNPSTPPSVVSHACSTPPAPTLFWYSPHGPWPCLQVS